MTADDDRRFVAHSVRTSMFFPQSRLFVAGNPKAAGTSMRWWLLQAHGVDVEARTARSLWGESAPYQTVWDEQTDLDYTWSDLSDADQADGLESADVLTVKPIRNPVTRTFSTWAGKYLTLEPYYYDQLPEGFPPSPHIIESADHIRKLFTEFMASLRAATQDNPDWTGIDVHFWPQHRLLARKVAGSELILKQESMQPGLQQIVKHLQEHDIDAHPMPRLNENVVPYRPEFISDGALMDVEEMYGADFETWGYQTGRPSDSSQELDLPWLNDLRGRNRRYRVIHEIATRNRQRIQELNRELKDARRREQDILTSHSWRVTKPLRAATGVFKRGKP